MKNIIKLLLLIGVILIMAIPAFSLGTVTGVSPVQNTLNVSVRVPQRVGIKLSGTDIEFFLDDPAVTYPPTTFPGYYFPTNVAASPHVPLEVFCNNPAGWTLTVQASGDFDASLPVTQLFYAPAGEAQTADGTAAPGGNWVAFSTAAATVASSATKTTAWEAHDQDYELQITGNEDVIDPEATVTITYTITSP